MAKGGLPFARIGSEDAVQVGEIDLFGYIEEQERAKTAVEGKVGLIHGSRSDSGGAQYVTRRSFSTYERPFSAAVSLGFHAEAGRLRSWYRAVVSKYPKVCRGFAQMHGA